MKALAHHLHVLAHRVVVALVPLRQDRVTVVLVHRQVAVLVRRQVGLVLQVAALVRRLIVQDQAIVAPALQTRVVLAALAHRLQDQAQDHLAHLVEDNRL